MYKFYRFKASTTGSELPSAVVAFLLLTLPCIEASQRISILAAAGPKQGQGLGIAPTSTTQAMSQMTTRLSKPED